MRVIFVPQIEREIADRLTQPCSEPYGALRRDRVPCLVEGVVDAFLGILKEIGLPLTELALPLAALPVVGLLALVPSYFLSLRIFRKKDL